ncbi:hypothetical protein WN943_006396 [Citrus x changshan-huyou]
MGHGTACSHFSGTYIDDYVLSTLLIPEIMIKQSGGVEYFSDENPPTLNGILTTLTVRSYTWVNIVFGIVSVSLLPVQSLADLTPRFFIEILKVIVPTLLMNTFLTALKQIWDVEIDKGYININDAQINKPYLPLASGDLSMGTAIAICIGSAILSYALGIMSGSPPLPLIQILCFLCGCAYSLPLPFLRWKSKTFMAPLTLVILMGFTLQLPFCMHMQQYVLGRPFVLTRPLISTVAIMSIFAFVNGLLKVTGDKRLTVYCKRLTDNIQKRYFMQVLNRLA